MLCCIRHGTRAGDANGEQLPAAKDRSPRGSSLAVGTARSCVLIGNNSTLAGATGPVGLIQAQHLHQDVQSKDLGIFHLLLPAGH